MKKLEEIVITPEALTLIERFLASCIEVKVPIETLRFLKDGTVTLFELSKKAPGVANKLLRFCEQYSINQVGHNEVIAHFAGPSHMGSVREKIETNYIVLATGQSIVERFKEVGIHYAASSCKTAFALLDIALPCEVIAINGRLVKVAYFDKIIANCVRPDAVKISKNEWVLCHKGAVIIRINGHDELTRIRELLHDKTYLEELQKNSPKYIDCHNFCPSTKSKKDGCDLTAWNLDRL